MVWPNFIENVHSALKNGDTFNDFHAPMAKKQDLTEVAGIGLRKLHAETFNLPSVSNKLIDIVIHVRCGLDDEMHLLNKYVGP